jgi:hypothetical protein
LIPTAASLLAGATGPHGRHERLGDDGDGWDMWRRQHTADHADALAYGRHARTDTPVEEKTR